MTTTAVPQHAAASCASQRIMVAARRRPAARAAATMFLYVVARLHPLRRLAAPCCIVRYDDASHPHGTAAWTKIEGMRNLLPTTPCVPSSYCCRRCYPGRRPPPAAGDRRCKNRRHRLRSWFLCCDVDPCSCALRATTRTDGGGRCRVAYHGAISTPPRQRLFCRRATPLVPLLHLRRQRGTMWRIAAPPWCTSLLRPSARAGGVDEVFSSRRHHLARRRLELHPRRLERLARGDEAVDRLDERVCVLRATRQQRRVLDVRLGSPQADLLRASHRQSPTTRQFLQ